MPYCFVPLCRSGNPKYTKQLKAEGQGIPRFFTAPNQELLQIWNTKIKRGDKQLSMSDCVCSNHFSADDVVLFFETRLSDGTINRIPRDRARLKEGAVPHIFEGYPSHRKTVTKGKKTPVGSEMKSVTKGRKNATIVREKAEIHLEAVDKSERNKITYQATEDTCQNPQKSLANEYSTTFERAPDNHKCSARSRVRLLRKQSSTEKQAVASGLKDITTSKRNSTVETKSTGINIEEVKRSVNTEIPCHAVEDINTSQSVLNKCTPAFKQAPDENEHRSCNKVGLLNTACFQVEEDPTRTLAAKQAKLKDGVIPHIVQGYVLHHRKVPKREKSPMASATKAIATSKQNSTVEIKSTIIHLKEVTTLDRTEILPQAEKDISPGKSVLNECSPTFEQAPDENELGLLNTACFQVKEDPTQPLTAMHAKLKDGVIPDSVQRYLLHHRKVLKREKSPMASAMKAITTSKQNSTVEIKSTGVHLKEVTALDRTEIHPQAEKTISPGKSILNECSPKLEQASNDNKRWSCNKVGLLILPTRWVVCNTPHTCDKILVHINDNMEIDKSIKFRDKADVEIKVKGVDYKSGLQLKIETVQDAQNLLNSINRLRVCCGTKKNSDPFSTNCFGVTKSQNHMRCDACSNEKEKMRKRAARLVKIQARAQEKKLKISSRLKQLEKSKTRLMLRVKALKVKIKEAMIRCEAVKRKSLEEAISQLPTAQQEAVRICFDAAKNKGPYGRRYTMEWTNKCLLMRIKSPKLYDYIRTQNILPLPANSTLTTYTRNIGAASSLQHLKVDSMKEKATDADEVENCEGEIMLDENELTPSTTSDTANLIV